MKTRTGAIGILLLLAAANVSSAAERFVATNGNDSAAGTNWPTAKMTIQAGVDAATDGDTVWVSNGVYATGGRRVLSLLPTNRVVIDKGIAVRSVNGPAWTVIQGARDPSTTNGLGDAAVRCVHVGSNANTVLSGFTLRGGATQTTNAPTVPNRSGGGVAGTYPASPSIVENCILAGNIALYGGGAISCVLKNCLIVSNEAASLGGGAYKCTFYNCVLTANSSQTTGGGASTCTSYNSIVYGNIAPMSSNQFACAISWSCTAPAADGTGNIAENPLFVDAAAGNFRLSPSSPCINAGDTSTVSSAVDLDGNPRIVDGAVDMGAYEYQAEGGTVLIATPVRTNVGDGAASGLALGVTANVAWTAATNAPWLAISSGESGTTNGTILFDVAANAGAARTGAVIVAGGGLSRTCTVVQAAFVPALAVSPASRNVGSGGASGLALGVTANVAWTAKTNAPWLAITSGESGTTNGTVVFSVASNGLAMSRTGAVVVAGGGLSRMCQVVQAPGVFVPTNWYVATNGSDAADGASWATAKQTIQAGVDAASAGDMVWVSNGVYATGGRVANGSTWTNRVAVTTAITLRSVNGPEVTIIDGSNQVRGIYLSTNAVLDGITVTRGNADNGGGVYCANIGILTNCLLLTNAAQRNGGGVNGGTLYNCRLTGNAAGGIGYGGGACESTLYNCRLTGNTAGRSDDGGGGGSFGGTLNNCELIGNGASYGGGAFFGRLNNCTLTSNSAYCGGGTYRVHQLYNSIIYGNFSDYGPNTFWNYTIANCWETDPLFVNAAAGNYRLQSNSPCIDAGNNDYVQSTTDLDGNPRIINGMADIGAYEVIPTLAFASPDIHLPCNSTNGLGIPILSSVPWTASTNAPWLAISSGASGTTNGTVVFGVEANPVVWGARTGAMVVAGGGLSCTCLVVQAGISPKLVIAPAATNLSFEEASEVSIEVEANIPWAATTNVPWLAITSGETGTTNGMVVFSVAASGGTTTRTGAVVVAGGGVSRTCSVVQVARVLAIAPASATLPGEGGSGMAIAVAANLPWMATTNVPWISITSGESGTTNGTLVFNVEFNPGASRTGAIVFAGGGLVRTCTVVQTPMLAVIPEDIHLSSGSANGNELAVTANVPWTATTNVSWLAITSGGSGTTNGTVVFNVAANGGEVSRTGAIAIVCSGIARTCLVSQAGGGVDVTAWFVATNGDDSADGTSWATAKATIQAGVVTSSGGDTIWVSNGVYIGLLTLNKGVRVQSSNGPDVTTIQGANSRCAEVGHADATISGFTLTGGTAEWGGGAYISEGTLEGCIIRDNMATGRTESDGFGHWGVSSYGGGIYGGILRNCEIYRNTAQALGGMLAPAVAQGGGAYRSHLINCLVKSNAVIAMYCTSASAGAQGGGTQGGTNENCTVVGNSASASAVPREFANASGGGCNGSTILNSIVYYNEGGDVEGGSSSYSCSLDIGTSNGNRTSAPSFINPSDGNYRLMTNSPCLDTGTNRPWMSAATDLDGNPRIAYGTVDMGAYERPPDPMLLLDARPASTNVGCGGAIGLVIGVTANVPWTASTNVPWLAITAGESGTTNGTVVFDVAANEGASLRAGTIAVTGGGSSCSYTVLQFYEGQPTNGYYDWATGITNGLTNATDCAAGDGVPNLLKYATGCLAPMEPEDLARLGVLAGGVPALTFNRNLNAVDLMLVIQGADSISNGAAWRGVATNVGGSWLGATNVEESGAGNPVECTVTDPVALDSNRFLRLRVSRP